MNHKEVFMVLLKKLGKGIPDPDVNVLKNIIAAIAKKDNSIDDFYQELMTTTEFLSLASISKVAEKYSVPALYGNHIDKRYEAFKANIKAVCSVNKDREDQKLPPAFKADK